MIFCSALLRISSRNIFKVENFHLNPDLQIVESYWDTPISKYELQD